MEVKNLGRDDCSFSVENTNTTIDATVKEATVTLHPYSRYKISVYAYNSLGHSNASIGTDVFWTLENGWSDASNNYNHVA